MTDVCLKCNGRGYIQWHPYWDNGNDPCDQCRPAKLAAPDPAAIREAALREAAAEPAILRALEAEGLT